MSPEGPMYARSLVKVALIETWIDSIYRHKEMQETILPVSFWLLLRISLKWMLCFLSSSGLKFIEHRFCHMTEITIMPRMTLHQNNRPGILSITSIMLILGN